MKNLPIIQLICFTGVVNLKAEIKNSDSKPNIIIFMSDDMGYADAGFTGSEDILTPDLDNRGGRCKMVRTCIRRDRFFLESIPEDARESGYPGNNFKFCDRPYK